MFSIFAVENREKMLNSIKFNVLVFLLFPVYICYGQNIEPVKPTASQIFWAESEWGVVFHYDLHVFDGKRYNQTQNRIHPIEDANLFQPTQLNTDQWIESIAAAGAKFALLTATHETGFGLWQSDVNPFCLKATSWRDGKGDVVADFVASCRKYGIRPGIYVGIRWNTHFGIHDFKVDSDNTQITQAEYRKMCEQMVEELCSCYGDIFMIWFDGGADNPHGNGPDVEPIVNRLQPACLFYHNTERADLRWGGSESGTVNYPCYSTFPTPYSHSNQSDWKKHQKLLAQGDPDGAYWVPAMADTPLRGANGRHEWFWEPGDEDNILSTETLLDMYEKSVGRNATLMIGLTPDPHGLLPAGDSIRLKEFADAVSNRYGKSLGETSANDTTATIVMKKPQSISRYLIQEDISQGERVREYCIEAFVNGKWVEVDNGTSVGHKRLGAFDTVVTDRVRLRVLKSVVEPIILRFAVFK